MRTDIKSILLVSALLIIFARCAIPAAKTEKGPAYLTDSHGASGVAHVLIELSEIDPKYTPYWKGALDWLIHVAQRDDAGRMTWYMSVSAPKGHPRHMFNLSGICHIVRMFLTGYEKSGDRRYKNAALAATRWLTEVAMLKRRTKLGMGCGWSHSYRPNDRSIGLLAGHSHGLGNFISTLLEIYKVKPDPRLRKILRGVLINLALRGKTIDDGNKTMFAWPARKNKNVFETGYCYGQAGIVIPLCDLAECMPDLKLDDGTTALSLANASLRYLMSVARKVDDGYVWPYMRHNQRSLNIGYGSGTGGIGWAFLKGAQANRKSNPEFAAECMKYARGAAVFAVKQIMATSATQPYPRPGGDRGFGVCGGVSGSGYFLILFANEIRDSDPEFTEKINRAVRRSAERLLATAAKLDGMLVWKKDERTVNIALDYGQTGVVLALTVVGKYLKDDQFINAARKGADYIVSCAVKEGGGYKFAQFHELP